MKRDLKNLTKFPLMLADLLWTIFFYTFTEPITFLLAASATSLGLILGWEWGVASFIIGYTFLRVVGSWITAFGDMTTFIGRAIASVTYKEEPSNNDHDPTPQSRSPEAGG